MNKNKFVGSNSVLNNKTGYIILVLFLFITGFSYTMAQEAVVTTGGEGRGSGGSISYSIGQVAYTNASTKGVSITEGVQQPFEIFIISGVEDSKGINLVCSAFPNPTKEKLTLKIENLSFVNLSYQLFDINGKLLKSGKITGNETDVDISSYTSAAYYLKVIGASKKDEIKTFEIIKN